MTFPKWISGYSSNNPNTAWGNGFALGLVAGIALMLLFFGPWACR